MTKVSGQQMHRPKFYIGDLVYRVEDEAQCIVVNAIQEFCSHCLTDSGPFKYSVHIIDHERGKCAWFRDDELVLVSRHSRLEATPPLNRRGL